MSDGPILIFPASFIKFKHSNFVICPISFTFCFYICLLQCTFLVRGTVNSLNIICHFSKIHSIFNIAFYSLFVFFYFISLK